jgi:hypothetical protein
MPHNVLFFPKSHFLLYCLLDDISLRIPWEVPVQEKAAGAETAQAFLRLIISPKYEAPD